MVFLKNIKCAAWKIVLILALIGAAVLAILLAQPDYHASFVVTGDVAEVLTVESIDGFDTTTAVRDGKRYTGIALSDLIDAAQPVAADNTVVIRGSDGLLAEVDANQLQGMHVVYTADNGWEMINDFHPPSSNIKNIAEVWVVAKSTVREIAVNVIRTDENILSLTPGQFFMRQTAFAPLFHGESEVDVQNEAYHVAVYTERRFLDVTDIAPDAQSVLVMGEEGGYAYDASPGRITLIGNTLYYVCSDGKTSMENVRGVLIDPPNASNMDAFQEAINNVDNDVRTMVVLVDGFAYHQYTYATDNGIAPYMASLAPAKLATSVYKPVTHAGLSAMLTGAPPCDNGIYQRGMSELQVPDIFTRMSAMDKTSQYIEGSINIVNTSMRATLNADRDGDGLTDNEVFESAMEAIASDADFLFVHFHGVDDLGHDYGDIAQPVMDKITEVDGYLQTMAEAFSGRLIITTDHGMHSTNDGGSHGVFRYEDIIIPYISVVVE